MIMIMKTTDDYMLSFNDLMVVKGVLNWYFYVGNSHET